MTGSNSLPLPKHIFEPVPGAPVACVLCNYAEDMHPKIMDHPFEPGNSLINPNICRACDETKDKHPKEIEVDPVNHPSHYTQYKGLEIIDLVEQMNYNRGNAVKYIARAGFKNPDTEIQDLEKAAWYINREIERIRKGKDELPTTLPIDRFLDHHEERGGYYIDLFDEPTDLEKQALASRGYVVDQTRKNVYFKARTAPNPLVNALAHMLDYVEKNNQNWVVLPSLPSDEEFEYLRARGYRVDQASPHRWIKREADVQ
jgi:hypothetical protein